MFRNWRFHELGERAYEETIGEMRHADRLIERILFLDGLPNLQDLGKLRIGENVPEALDSDLRLEMTVRDDTAASITLFEREHDYVSREIAAKILIDSEEHGDFLRDADSFDRIARGSELSAVRRRKTPLGELTIDDRRTER
jgi:bacterioferritin